MATKDKTATVSGAGWVCHFFGELTDGLLAKGHTPEEIHTLVTAKGKPAMEKIVEEVSRFLRTLTVLVWKIFNVGGISKDGLLARLEREDSHVSTWAQDIMSKPGFKTSAKSRKVHFAKVKVGDLGFTESPTTTELLARVREVGELCESEDGPNIRLADKDQEKGTGYWIAMEPITDSDGDPYVFYVNRSDDGERWLNAYYASPGRRWFLGDEVVFRLRE